MVRSSPPSGIGPVTEKYFDDKEAPLQAARLTEWLALNVAVPYFAEITPWRARIFCPSAPPTNSKKRFAAPCGAPRVTTPRSLKNLYLPSCTASGEGEAAVNADGLDVVTFAQAGAYVYNTDRGGAFIQRVEHFAATHQRDSVGDNLQI